MTTQYSLSMKWLLLLLFVFPVTESSANIPFRVSIKFIVDSHGNRPATGGFTTDDQIDAQEAIGNEILAAQKSELRIEVTEIIELPTSLSAYATISVSAANVVVIRDLALASPTAWSWRTNAFNVYVTGGSGSAWSSRPPDNNIILMGQNIFDTTLLHELGHDLDLRHTHQDGGADGCADTLDDNDAWLSRDEMANANYEKDYALLTASQQYDVDMTWFNIMSYHHPRDRLTPCQKDRISGTASDDRDWLLTKMPLYVHPGNSVSCSGTASCNGTWQSPFRGFQDVLNSGVAAGKAIVVEEGYYTITQSSSINTDVDIFTREGTSVIEREGLLYELPVDPGLSKNAAVGASVRQAQREATLGRKALRSGNTNAAAAKAQDRAAIMKLAEQKSQGHKLKVIDYYLQAETQAAGNEKLSIQMELAQRYWHSQNYEQCLIYYNRVAAGTDQFHLKQKAIRHADQCKEKIMELKQGE